MIILFTACDTEESLHITQPEATFTLNDPSATNIFLNFSLPENPAFTITWVDEITGSSSYTVEMSTDAEFAEPFTLGTTSSKSFTMNVVDFNEILSSAEVESFSNAAIYMRVLAGSNISNTIIFTVNSYPENNPVITSPDSTFEVVLSDITESETAITVEWDDPDFSDESDVVINYHIEAATAGTDFATALSLGETQDRTFDATHAELNDIALNSGIAAGSAGSLDIRIRSVIETASGDIERISESITITVTPYETTLPPVLYGVGAGMSDAGWGWSSPVEFFLQGKVYSANVNLTPENGGNFRFFLQQDWGPDSYNYPWYSDRGYTIDPNLVNANDGDSNFQFVGTAGLYNLKIDTANKTITLGAPVIGPSISDWGVVGSGYNNWGAFADGAFYSSDDPSVIVSYVTLVDGEIKFRLNNDWGTNYGDNGGDNTLEINGANIPVTAGTYKISVNINTLSYTIEPYSWGIVGSGYNDWGATPDARLTYDPVSNTFKVGVKLLDGEIKFRLNSDWGINYGDDGANGTIDNGGSNIAVTAGYYAITLDLVNGTYSIDPVSIWGVVGSGYNNWGSDGPDFSFTPLSNDIWVAEIVPLIDGEIKFRLNNDWGTNYGDTGADGTLDNGGDNLAVTAGNYRIKLDMANLTYEINKVN